MEESGANPSCIEGTRRDMSFQRPDLRLRAIVAAQQRMAEAPKLVCHSGNIEQISGIKAYSTATQQLLKFG